MATAHAVKVTSVPVRIAVAGLWTLFAWNVPAVAAVFLGMAFAAGVAVLVAAVLFRRAFRWDPRVACPDPTCSYRPLRMARICPVCQTPVLFAGLHGTSAATRRAAVQAAGALMRADGRIDAAEQEYLVAVARSAGVEADGTAAIDQLEVDGVPEHERSRILDVAAGVVVADGELVDAEVDAYLQLASRLGVDRRAAARRLRRWRAGLSG